MWTGVTSGFWASGVVARAFDTASTRDGSFAESFDASCSGPLFWPAGCPDDLAAGSLRWGGVCLGRRPRGPGGGGVPRVANARSCWRGSRNDHLTAVEYMVETNVVRPISSRCSVFCRVVMSRAGCQCTAYMAACGGVARSIDEEVPCRSNILAAHRW
jgi:hypothetical protein